MIINGYSALVTGGASGLGRATAERLAQQGAKVVIADLEVSEGADVARNIGGSTRFVPANVTDPVQMAAAFDAAEEIAPLHAVVNCAGRGGTVRVIEKTGEPGSFELFEEIVRVNLVGTFNVLSQGAARMARNEPVEGERGVVVLTSSVAAFEGQIGQIPYASAKAGIVGMTLVAARDVARHLIRVCTIAPGTFDTPILSRFGPEVLEALAKAVPHPARLGQPKEFAALVAHIVENAMMNGETIRLDGAIRMPPR